ncbi:MAG: hypothetical protein RBS05_12505 [Zoogloea oleivorans]|jgi:hypothetical protein|uniref:portal protein n=1 Tax=Zoogloea oleivorans TaxID=1552750 RepID=UPI002A36951C|nr:hypothetical protein [Zoogloea oleivorans]MDY0036722.1 hypothetical protein [Zoogloea oleivorans]
MDDTTTRTDGLHASEEDHVLSDRAPEDIARRNNERFRYGIDRGHRDYTRLAGRLEGFYLGSDRDGEGNIVCGGQWSEEDLAILQEQGRPAYEFNEIGPAVRSALGYQISNRMDIAFRPRGGDATKELAETRTKVANQIADNNRLHWKETEVFSDGLIQQRGYYDVRMSFDDSLFGELSITVLDPMDVIPDPDAKSYDPSCWQDVIILRWLTLDEIEGLYGKAAAERLKDAAHAEIGNEGDFGDYDDSGERRAKFGSRLGYSGYWDGRYMDGYHPNRYRVIDRQHYIRTTMDVAVTPSGDVRVLVGGETQEVMDKMRADGAVIMKRRMKRVRWTVSTLNDVLLHDAWSPYDRFTVVPYFPYFRRGRTRGMVDGAIDPQRVLNKAISQHIHIVNTTANSGWIVEEDSLTNMTTEELEEEGARTGLVLEVRRNAAPPRKIDPNHVPTGVDRLVDRASATLKEVTVPDAMRGAQGPETSGIAIQSKQHAAQQQLSVPLDNLARTRNLVAGWIDYAISSFYDSMRVFRITKQDSASGKEVTEEVAINQFDPESNRYINDMTAGEYDVVVTEQPIQVTFENSQFTQVLEMRNAGVNIPDQFVIRNSNLQDKHEIISALEGMQKPPPDPRAEAEAELAKARAEKERALASKHSAEAVSSSIEGIYSATQAGATIASQPAVAPLADRLLRSAGFQDRDAAPIVPQTGLPENVAAPDVRQNTSPMFPPRPDDPDASLPESPDIGPDTPVPAAEGARQGIETQQIEPLE